MERYVAMAFEVAVSPVIVPTKTDLCDNPHQYIEDAQTISTSVRVVVLDARGDEPKSKLAEWSGPGQTIRFLGSSGVGKSTLVNALSETQSIATQAILEKDDKGRHTTTSWQIHVLASGCAILAAVEVGTIDSARLKRREKLAAEERYNSINLAERKSDEKALGKMIRSIQKGNRKSGK